MMETFILATNNPKKLKEMQRILSPLGVSVQTAKQAGVCLDDVEETGTTFEENAALKARAAFKRTGKPCIADDSGLMVDALNGEPGVYSARYSGENATDKTNVEKLLFKLQSIPKKKRTARFVTTIFCILPSGEELVVNGECHGEIGTSPVGESGFGYDPVFFKKDGNSLENAKSFAQLSPEEKDSVSHRGKALRKLKEELQKYL